MANDFSAKAEPISNMENAEQQTPLAQSTNMEKLTIDDVLALAQETFPMAPLPLGLIINYETLREEYPPLKGHTQHAAHLISGNPQWDSVMLLQTTVLGPNERHEDLLAKVAKELAEVDPFKDIEPTKFLTMTESLLAEVHWAWEGLEDNAVKEKQLQDEIVELKSVLQKHHSCTTTRNNAGTDEESPAFVERDIHNTVIEDLQAEQSKNENLNQKNVEKDIRLVSLSEEVHGLRDQVLTLANEKSSLGNLIYSKDSALNAQSETVHHLVEKVNTKDKHIIEQANQLWTLRKLVESNANTLHLERVVSQKDMEIEHLTQHFRDQLERGASDLETSQASKQLLELENAKLRHNVQIASWIIYMRGQYIPSYYPNQFVAQGHRFSPQEIIEGTNLFYTVSCGITRLLGQVNAPRARPGLEEELDESRIRIFELEKLSAEEQKEHVKSTAGLELFLREMVTQNEANALHIHTLECELEVTRLAYRTSRHVLEDLRFATSLEEKEMETKLNNAVFTLEQELEEYKTLGREGDDSDSEDDSECSDDDEDDCDDSNDGSEDGSDSEDEGSYDGDGDEIAGDCPRVICIVKFAELHERYKHGVQRLSEFEEAQNSPLAEYSLSRGAEAVSQEEEEFSSSTESEEEEEKGEEDEYEDASEGCDSDEDCTEDNEDSEDDDSDDESDSGDKPVDSFKELYTYYTIAMERIGELELNLAETSRNSIKSQLEFQRVVDELDGANRRLDSMAQDFVEAHQELEEVNDYVAHLEENEDRLNDAHRILSKQLAEAKAQIEAEDCKTAEAAAEAADEMEEVRAECNSLYTYISELEEQRKNSSAQLEKKPCEYKKQWEINSNQYGILKVYAQNLAEDLEKKKSKITSLEHLAEARLADFDSVTKTLDEVRWSFGDQYEELQELRATKQALLEEKQQRREYLEEEFVQRTRLELQQQSNGAMQRLINKLTLQVQEQSLQNYSLYNDVQSLHHVNQNLGVLLDAAHNEYAIIENRLAILVATAQEQTQTAAHYNDRGERLMEENNQKCAEIYRLEELFTAKEKAHSEQTSKLRVAEERVQAAQVDSERYQTMMQATERKWELKVTELKQALNSVKGRLAQEQEDAADVRAALNTRLAISTIPLLVVNRQHAVRIQQWKTDCQNLTTSEESARILHDLEIARCEDLEDKIQLTEDSYQELRQAAKAQAKALADAEANKCSLQHRVRADAEVIKTHKAIIAKLEASNTSSTKLCAGKQALLDDYRTAIVDLETTNKTLTERCNHNQALIDTANTELKHLAATDKSQKELILLHARQTHTQAIMINKLEADVKFHRERVFALESYLNEEYDMQMPTVAEYGAIDTEPIDISSADDFSDCELVEPEECRSQ